MQARNGIPGLAVFAGLVGLACAARSPGAQPCTPVPQDLWVRGQPVYRECDLDRAARPPATMPRVQYTPSARQTCLRAVVDVVVNGEGRPIPETVRIVRATEPGFAQAVIASLPAMRYQPAMKDGAPVSQLVRVDRGISGQVVVVPAGTPPSSVRPPRGALPRC